MVEKLEPPELKPCPFCGSKNIDPKGWTSVGFHSVVCDDCRGSTDDVETWNRRAPALDPADEGLVELIAREIEPLAWRWRDGVVRPFAEGRGSMDNEPHQSYARAWADGVRTADDAHEWCLNDDSYAASLLGQSLTKARAVIAVISKEQGT